MTIPSPPPRVAVVTNVLSRYRVPCFEALAARLGDRVDFYFLAKDMRHRAYVLAAGGGSLSGHVLPGWSWSRPPFDAVHLNDPRPALRGYDLVIIGGWAEPSYILLWILALLKRVPIGFWVESTAADFLRDSWRETVKRGLLRRSMGVVVPGRSAADYCERLGMPRDRIFTAPNAVDTAYFRRQAETLLPRRDELRRSLGWDGVVVLFVGRMVDELKGISTLIAAQRRLETEGSDAHLVAIGEGPDRAGCEARCREWGLRSVEFLDFMDHEKLCRYYAAADIFALPSRSEPWGLVLNEAMEFGLPLVATSAVGAARDLVLDGENGFVVPPGDPDRLEEALNRLIGEPKLRRRMGEESRSRIAAFTPERWADGFARAIEGMSSGRRTSVGIRP